MIPVRGVNVYPTAVENIVREDGAISEFQIEVSERRRMWEMRVEIEVNEGANAGEVRARLERELHLRLGLRAEVLLAPPGRLPRFELKARRFRVLPSGSQNET